MKLRSLWRKRKDVMKLNDKEAESKARSEAALQALYEENKRLGLYDYEIGFIDGKASVKREWVGLTEEDKQIAFDDTQEGGGFWEFADAIEAKLKEKNT